MVVSRGGRSRKIFWVASTRGLLGGVEKEDDSCHVSSHCSSGVGVSSNGDGGD